MSAQTEPSTKKENPMSDLETAAWEISWPIDDGHRERRFGGCNSVGDYRASVHPDAVSRELVYRDEAEAAIDAARSDKPPA